MIIGKKLLIKAHGKQILEIKGSCIIELQGNNLKSLMS